MPQCYVMRTLPVLLLLWIMQKQFKREYFRCDEMPLDANTEPSVLSCLLSLWGGGGGGVGGGIY